MKQEFMRIGGARTEKEFYEMYPTEQDFIKKHGGAINKLMAKGGEAYPQTATMDNFFSYGVPVPPTYYRQGGAFPMAQPENQFFSPFYGNVPNPYNKAMGGSSEAYPQSMSFPYGNTGRSTHFMMQDGGDMPEDQTLPKMGVNGKLLEFVGTVKNTAANKLNSNLATYGKVKNPEQYEFEQARDGGNLKGYQSKDTPGGINNYNYKFNKGPLFEQRNLPQIDYNSDNGTVTNNYYYGPGQQGQQGQQDPNNLPPEYTNDVDYLYGRKRPYSDFNIKGKGALGKYRATGTLEEEYGLEKLREMGLRDVAYDRPKWYQLLKRPRTTYHFDPYTQPNQTNQTSQQPASSTPDQVDQQNVNASNTSNVPGTNVANNASNVNTPVAPTISQQGSPNDMGFLARMFYKPGNVTGQGRNVTPGTPSDLNAAMSPRMTSAFEARGYNPRYSEARNQIFQNRRQRIGEKLDAMYQKRDDMDDMGLNVSNKYNRKMTRLGNRFNRTGTGRGTNYSFNTY
jgi:hypothetical protein